MLDPRRAAGNAAPERTFDRPLRTGRSPRRLPRLGMVEPEGHAIRTRGCPRGDTTSAPASFGQGPLALPLKPGIWHPGSVTFWLALRQLLPLLAAFSLALTPVTASAAATRMHASMTAQAHAAHEAKPAINPAGIDMARMDMADMPCCPPVKAEKPDCAKAGCPLMALCLASIAPLLPSAIAIRARIATHAVLTWPAAASFASLHGPPLPEPPRA